MQEARLSFGLIAFLLSTGAAFAAPAELPLDQVDGFLRQGGIVSAWSIQQYHNERVAGVWSITAYSGRETLGEHLCTTQMTQLEVMEEGGKLSLAHNDKHTLYAFEPCAWTSPEEFHQVRGKVDPAQLEQDFATIVSVIKGTPPKDLKVTFSDEEYRDALVALRRNDIADIDTDHSGHLQICFISGLVDEVGAIKKLSVEVIPGGTTEVRVDLCGTVDVAPK